MTDNILPFTISYAEFDFVKKENLFEPKLISQNSLFFESIAYTKLKYIFTFIGKTECSLT